MDPKCTKESVYQWATNLYKIAFKYDLQNSFIIPKYLPFECFDYKLSVNNKLVMITNGIVLSMLNVNFSLFEILMDFKNSK